MNVKITNKNILIACEESQTVCKAFREKGFNAYSCDIQNCSGGHPEWHILGDASNVINSNQFDTMDGCIHIISKWDLIIAHPPCTYLTTTGNRWFNIQKYGDKAIQRIKNREKSCTIFYVFCECPLRSYCN